MAVGVLLDDDHQEAVLEPDRAPHPVEALRRILLREPAALLPWDRAHAPAAVAGAGPPARGQEDLLAAAADPALAVARLHEAPPLQGESAAAPLEVVRLPERGEVRRPGDLVRQPVGIAGIGRTAQHELLQRALDADPERTDGQFRPVVPERVRRPHRVQEVTPPQGGVRVDHPEVRIDTESQDEQRPSLVVEDVEDAAVVGVPVAGRDVLHGQGHLVHGVLVEGDGAVVGHVRPPWGHGSRPPHGGVRSPGGEIDGTSDIARGPDAVPRPEDPHAAGGAPRPDRSRHPVRAGRELTPDCVGR